MLRRAELVCSRPSSQVRREIVSGKPGGQLCTGFATELTSLPDVVVFLCAIKLSRVDVPKSVGKVSDVFQIEAQASEAPS